MLFAVLNDIYHVIPRAFGKHAVSGQSESALYKISSLYK